MKSIIKMRTLSDIEMTLERSGVALSDKMEILDAAKEALGIKVPCIDNSSIDKSMSCDYATNLRMKFLGSMGNVQQ